MRTTRRLERNPLGEWAPHNDQTEAAADNQTEAKADKTDWRINSNRRNVDRHKETQPKAYNFFSLRGNGEATIERTQFFLLISILMIKLLLFIVLVLSWISFLFFLRSLAIWEGFQRIASGFPRRRDAALRREAAVAAGEQPADNAEDTFLEDVFPEDISFASYQLNMYITSNAFNNARVIFGRRFPLLFANPVMWLIVLFILFVSYRLLDFSHGCLQTANQKIKVTLFHQTLAKKRANQLQGH